MVTSVHDDDISAEEIYADLLQRVHVLTPMSVAYAEQGDVANAVLCTWAADVATAQAVAWERIVVVTHSPQTPFFALEIGWHGHFGKAWRQGRGPSRQRGISSRACGCDSWTRSMRISPRTSKRDSVR